MRCIVHVSRVPLGRPWFSPWCLSWSRPPLFLGNVTVVFFFFHSFHLQFHSPPPPPRAEWKLKHKLEHVTSLVKILSYVSLSQICLFCRPLRPHPHSLPSSLCVYDPCLCHITFLSVPQTSQPRSHLSFPICSVLPKMFFSLTLPG